MRNFDGSYLEMAEVWAKNSRAIKAKVGALIVKDNMIISDGFNGTPAGFENECEYVVGCKNPSMEGVTEWKPGITCRQIGKDNDTGIPYLKCTVCDKDNIKCKFAILKTKPYVLHAEANAITKLAKSNNSSCSALPNNQTEGSTLYITMSPCLDCAKLIIQSGIKRVVYKNEYWNDKKSGIDLLRKAGIEVVHYKEEKDPQK